MQTTATVRRKIFILGYRIFGCGNGLYGLHQLLE